MKTILVDAWNTLFLEDGIFQEMYELLEKYPNKKIVLTNANAEAQIKYGMDKSPYELFTLNHNPDKIELDYYYQMFNKFNLEKDDVVYFEHNEGAVKSARSVGIETYHYDKDQKDLNRLKEFLDNNL